MGHTYVVQFVHCIFSTKGRRRLIPVEVQPRLWEFIGGVARTNGFKALIVGGTDNHVHVLLSLPSTMALAKAMQSLKGASSRWMNETCTNRFSWQEGYGAFTIGVSQRADTVRYILGQGEHHRKRDFQAEFLAFLKKHGVEYDERFVLG